MVTTQEILGTLLRVQETRGTCQVTAVIVCGMVDWAGLELAILLSQLLECWDYKHETRHLVSYAMYSSCDLLSLGCSLPWTLLSYCMAILLPW